MSVAGLTTSYTYNCTGGVVTSVTDPNNATTSTSYTDPYFWRPASTTDPLSNVTYYNYYRVNNSGSSAVSSVGQTESVMTFNSGNSVQETLTTVDGWGRPQLAQNRQSPSSSNFDTVQLMYDENSRVQWALRPFVANAGQASGGGLPATGYTYDTLGRVTQVVDWANLTVTYGYNLNDTEVTVSGQPSGENPKSRQFEYDGLGRLSSACEVSSATGSGNCSQQTGAVGYFTSYTYDALGNLVGVSQSGQTRSFTYDGLSRMTSETNPETSQNGMGGTTQYEYDTSGQCGNSTGNLVERINAPGGTTCYAWDSLHRLSGVTYPNTPTMPTKTYLYDQSGYFGITENNPKGRMTGAYTYYGTYTSVTALSYDAVGRVTDEYQGAPHGGWYDVQQSYWPNGTVRSIQGFNGSTTLTAFGHSFTGAPDGEGRLYSIWDNTAAGWTLASTAYNVASEPTQVNVTGGNEAFQYDGSSGRMTQWKVTNGSNSQTGNLTWNGNATLQQLTVTDTNNPNANETCNYRYDDLTRLASDSCTNWLQTFTYDVWGNINKSGGLSFSSQGGSGNHAPGLTYDGIGEVIKDNLNNTFIYDVEGRPFSINGYGVTYDALNRAVEVQTGSSSYQQVLYSPNGQKFAFMNGTGVVSYMLLMPAGTQAVFNSGGLSYYRFADWLGTSRLATYPNGSLYVSRAYAPFGETYGGAGTGTNERLFTGQTRDVIAGPQGIYDFLFRQQSSSQGRWLVPDPAGLAAVDLTNPKTWNRYAYVGNNPLSSVDSLGLSDIPNQTTFQTGCGQDGACWTAFAQSQNSAHASGVNQGPRGSWDATDSLSFFFTDIKTTTASNSSDLFNLPQWNPPQLVSLANGDTQLTIGGWSVSSSTVNGIFVPGVLFTQTSDTTWAFTSDSPFGQTVQKFYQAGFSWDPFDPLHPGHMDLRDSTTLCSAHVDVAKNSGRTPGQQTTGTVHLDTINPYPSPYMQLLGPGAMLVTFSGHMALDVVGGGLYPGSEACK